MGNSAALLTGAAVSMRAVNYTAAYSISAGFSAASNVPLVP